MVLCLLGTPWLPRLANASQGEGEPFLQYFSSRDYHANTQCLCTTQDAQGVIYVGNIGVVLEYDGAVWRRIAVGHSSPVLGLAYERGTDTIFVGARGELGYLKAGPDGARVYVSLMDLLPADACEVGSVFGVYATPGGVYFVGTERVMRWRDGQFKTWPLVTASRLRSDWAAGSLYVFSQEVGLLRLDNESLVPVTDDPIFRRVSVRAVVANDDGTLLVGTNRDGLFNVRQGAVRPADIECNDFLKENGIYKIRRLRDGSLAFATVNAGLLLLDRAYHFRNHVDDSGGLHGSNLFELFEDAEGGLWISLQSGVTRAEIKSPFSVLRAGHEDDLSNTFCGDYALHSMYLGSHPGLYRVVPFNPAAFACAHLERLQGINASWASLCAVENGLLMVGNGEVSLLDADARKTPVPGAAPNAKYLYLNPSLVHPGRVYVTDDAGRISILRRDTASGQWTFDGVAAALGKAGECNAVESAQGDLWVGTKDHGLYRVRLPASGPAEVTSFYDRPGPFQGTPFVIPYSDGGPIYFNGIDKLYTLDEAGENLRPVTEFGPRLNDGSLRCENILGYGARSLWIVAKNANDPAGDAVGGRWIAGEAGREPVFQPLPHKVAEMMGEVRNFLPGELHSEEVNTLLLIGAVGNGVVRLDLRQWDAEPKPPPFATLIRRAVTTGQASSAGGTAPILGKPLAYVRNSVHFEYAGATFGFGAAPRFQTRLVNFGAGNWSDFSDRNSIDYLNLPEGGYTFEVRARNADGQMGQLASLGFRVLPPWQRSPWAYAAYALLAAGAVYALVRWQIWRLRAKNARLEQMIETRTGELRHAKNAAVTANRAKSAFLANMSHELRTPLNAILGYSQIMLKQADLPARSREQITVIGQSGGHLLALINEVLDLSKIEAGKLTLSPHDVSLPQLLDEVGATFRPRFSEKGLTFTETRSPGLPHTVHTDASRLRQVLFNLLSNSVKFTRKGNVSLDVRPTEKGWVRFAVSDTGVGIAPDATEDIFLAFHQVGENALSAQGTGLGLAISQQLVGLLGGRIEVESTVRQGSRFWVDLPLPQIEPRGGTPLPARSGPAHGGVTGYEGPPRSLLLVDDLAENRRVLRDFLQPLGFEIAEAADGEECLRACARPPDAVLLDLRLGALDGFEVARILRSRTNGGPLGIIAISASVFESDRQRALDAGCDDFLPKPFEEAQLLATLERVMGSRWVWSAATAPPSDAPDRDEPALPPDEFDALLELSLRGDIVGIRKRVEHLRAAGASGGAEAFARRLTPLIDAYQMEAIHALLLSLQTHGEK